MESSTRLHQFERHQAAGATASAGGSDRYLLIRISLASAMGAVVANPALLAKAVIGALERKTSPTRVCAPNVRARQATNSRSRVPSLRRRQFSATDSANSQVDPSGAIA